MMYRSLSPVCFVAAKEVHLWQRNEQMEGEIFVIGQLDGVGDNTLAGYAPQTGKRIILNRLASREIQKL